MEAISPVLVVGLYLISVNLLTAFLFHVDKQRAIRRDRRIPESNLLLLAMIGGTPGAKYAQRRFRHKTLKQPFAGALGVIGVIQIGGILLLLFPVVRDLLSGLLPPSG